MDVELKAYRKGASHSYAIGVFPTLELLAHRPEQVRRVLLSSRGETNQGVEKIIQLCSERDIPVEVSDRRIRRVAGNDNSYAVGVFDKYEAPLAPDANHLVLVQPDDAGNLGTIIRTMLGFDVLDLAVILPAVDLFAPRTVRASMGAVFQVRYSLFAQFDEYRERFGHTLYPFMTDGRQTLEQVAFHKPFALVFGNEGAGLGPEFREMGHSVQIPQTRRIDSLNLAISVGIALYAATRS